ncbi:hypothetical protein [Pseudazoarcus pumilus]|nr:hypothetical protein [Pseudazoarcus pumilus]
MSIDRETGFADVGERRPVKFEEGWIVGMVRQLVQLRNYVGLGRKREDPVRDVAGLAHFLDTRASFVAQTSLYGYLRTRAGMRYPELFDDDPFVVSINIAKWQIWLACLSDITAYAGVQLARQRGASADQVRDIVRAALAEVLERTGVPEEAGEAFADNAARVRERIAGCDWSAFVDEEAAFTESPGALVEWAPIVDHLKQLDADIVRNSVRFRWQEVRRDLRRSLDADAVLRAGSSSADT